RRTPIGRGADASGSGRDAGALAPGRRAACAAARRRDRCGADRSGRPRGACAARTGRRPGRRGRHSLARAGCREGLARRGVPRADDGAPAMNALRAELLKAVTTRLLLWFGLGLLAFLVLVLSIHIGSHDLQSLGERSTQRTTLAFGGLAAIVAVLIGSLLGAGMGVGIGALLRRQTGAVVAILRWLLIGEGVISAAGDSARFAPGRALGAVVAAHEVGARDVLGVWAAVAVGVLYAAIFCGAGFLVVLGSDAPTSGD